MTTSDQPSEPHAPDDLAPTRQIVSLNQITSQTIPEPDPSGQRGALGGKVLVWVVPFVATAFLLFAAYSWWSYPRLEQFTKLSPLPCVAAVPTPTGPPGGLAGTKAPAPAQCPANAVPAHIPGPDAATLAQAAKAAWLTQTKDLGQLFIITPLLPLLGSVIGYMVGRKETD